MPRLGLRSRSTLILSFTLAVFLVASSIRTFAEDHAAEPVDVADDWIYEDLDAGYAKAKETGKPLLIAFR